MKMLEAYYKKIHESHGPPSESLDLDILNPSDLQNQRPKIKTSDKGVGVDLV